MINIVVQQADGVLQLRLNRPEKKNAISQAMYTQLAGALQAAATDDNVRAVLLTGGDECFSAGNDLKDFLGAGELNVSHPTVQFLYQLARFPKPIVAAAAGLAIGIGTTALLHCDLVYATDSVRFQMPFTQLGLCPEAASSVLLPSIAGYQRAAQYLLLGEPFGIEQALQFGLVNQLVAKPDLIRFALNKAQQLAALPADAVQTSKALLKRSQQPGTEHTIATELEQFQRLLHTQVCQDKINAFFQR